MKPNSAPRTLADCHFAVGYPIIAAPRRRTWRDVAHDVCFVCISCAALAVTTFLYLSM